MNQTMIAPADVLADPEILSEDDAADQKCEATGVVLDVPVTCQQPQQMRVTFPHCCESKDTWLLCSQHTAILLDAVERDGWITCARCGATAIPTVVAL